MFKILYQPYKWLVFIPFFGLWTVIVAAFTVVFAFLFSPKIANYWGVIWARGCSLLVPMTVKVKGREHVKKGESYVIMANHQSGVDIFVLYGWLGIDFRWIMKKELRKSIGIGIACHKIGHIFVDRSSPKKAFQSIEEAKMKTEAGASIMIFPEGTRSGTNQMHTWKRGGFKMAMDMNLPILPVTIKNSFKILPKGYDLLPGKCELIFHAPLILQSM